MTKSEKKIISKQNVSFSNEIPLSCLAVSVLGILKCSLYISVIRPNNLIWIYQA